MGKGFFMLILILLSFQPAVAQDSDSFFKFDLLVRYRFELWDGFNAKNYGDDSPDVVGNLNDKFLLQRIIPGVTYRKGKINAEFHMQDSRAFGWSLSRKNYPDLYKIGNPLSEHSFYVMNPQEEYFEIYDPEKTHVPFTHPEYLGGGIYAHESGNEAGQTLAAYRYSWIFYAGRY
jgi:hypothetical protein